MVNAVGVDESRGDLPEPAGFGDRAVGARVGVEAGKVIRADQDAIRLRVDVVHREIRVVIKVGVALPSPCAHADDDAGSLVPDLATSAQLIAPPWKLETSTPKGRCAMTRPAREWRANPKMSAA